MISYMIGSAEMEPLGGIFAFANSDQTKNNDIILNFIGTGNMTADRRMKRIS